MATEMWRVFEARVKTDLNLLKVAVTQIPSSLNKSRGKTWRSKTDCDFAAAPDGRAVFFDAKVCAENLFNIKSLILRESKIHQYRFLLSCVERGAIGGYLIWFHTKGTIMWLPAENINILCENDDKSVGIGSPEGSTQGDHLPINLTKLIWGNK